MTKCDDYEFRVDNLKEIQVALEYRVLEAKRIAQEH